MQEKDIILFYSKKGITYQKGWERNDCIWNKISLLLFDIKENENFRRFNYRSADKVYKEFMLYAIGRNINKYCRFLNEKLKKFEGKTVWSKV